MVIGKEQKTARPGLTSEEAKRRLGETGPNLIYKMPGISFFRIARHWSGLPKIMAYAFTNLTII